MFMKIKRRFRVCVLGSGFGGTSVLANLKSLMRGNKEIELIMISNKEYFLFTPLLHEAATGEVDPENIIYPIKKLQEDLGNFNFIQENIIKLDFAAKTIKTESKNITYDYLVIALGSSTNFYGHQSIEKHAFSLKNIEDAIKINAHLQKVLEKAELETDPEKKKQLTTFVIAGGGATGVELTGGIVYFVREKIKSLKNIREEDIKIYLLELTDRLLHEMDDRRCSEIARQRFAEIGVETLLQHKVVSFDGNNIEVIKKSNKNKTILKTKTFIWTAGIKPAPLIEALELEKDDHGRVFVDRYLSLPDYPEVYIIVDNAAIKGEHLWTTAQTAVQEAETVAWNLYAKTRLFSYSKPFKYIDQGTLITIGKNYGITDILGFKITGYTGWFIWKLVHVAKLTGTKNKINVFFDWLKNLSNQRYSKYSGTEKE
jgi:NADH dehydrogenase